MSEQINAIVAEARALLASATAMPWRKGTGASVVADVPVPEMSGSDELRFYGGHLVGESIVERNAGAIVFAVNNLGTLCDALERSQFALEWWAADRAICVEALHEAWAVMDSMARAAGVVGTFLEQAAPLLRPDASGNVNAPNHVTAAFTDGVQSYEVTIRREGGKTPADIIGELTARAEGAEHARDIFLDGLGRIGAMCLAVLGDEWEGAPHDEMVGGLIDRVEEAEDRAHDEVNRRIETSHDLHIRLEQAEAQAAAMRGALDKLLFAVSLAASRIGRDRRVEDAAELGRMALSSDAGRALLDRLHAAEQDRDRMCEEVTRLLHRAVAAEAERDALRAAIAEAVDAFNRYSAPHGIQCPVYYDGAEAECDCWLSNTIGPLRSALRGQKLGAPVAESGE